jgi:hypothetical protein
MEIAVKRTALAVAAAAALLAPSSARAQDHSLERQVKAAFLYKFAGYVEWPANAFPAHDSPVTIGVYGDEALALDLAKLVAGRTSGGRPVTVVKVKSVEPLPDVRVLFVARSETGHLSEIAEAAAGKPILIVAEDEYAIGNGAMINFVLTGGRVRFEVDLAAVSHGSITLSSRLLAVAQQVLPEAR